MANGRRDLVKERYWREVLERHSASGLSARAFCRREQLAENGFYAWRRTIAQRDGAAEPTARSPAFVPAVVRGAETREAPILIAWDAGPQLRLPMTISAAWVAELLRALAVGAER